SCRSPRSPDGSCGGCARPWSRPQRPRWPSRSHSWSAHLLGLGRVLGAGAGRGPADPELALTHLGVDAGDVLADGLEPPVVLQLARGRLETEVEQLPLGLGQGVPQGTVLEATQLLRGQVLATDRHQMSPPSRATKRVFIGNLCMASRMASRATSSETPESSNRTRPGLTLATHHSGEPLPEPMRVSAGFLVSGRSG